MYLHCIPAHFYSHLLATGVFPKHSGSIRSSEASWCCEPHVGVARTGQRPSSSLSVSWQGSRLVALEAGGGVWWAAVEQPLLSAVPFQPPRHALCDLWLPQPAGRACGIHLQRDSGAGVRAKLWVVGTCDKKSWQAAGNPSLRQLGGLDSARTEGETLSRAFFPPRNRLGSPFGGVAVSPISTRDSQPWWAPCKADAWLVKGKQGVSRSTPRQERVRSGWWLGVEMSTVLITSAPGR